MILFLHFSKSPDYLPGEFSIKRLGKKERGGKYLRLRDLMKGTVAAEVSYRNRR